VRLYQCVTFFLYWSPFVRCPVYNRHKAKFMHGTNCLEGNIKKLRYLARMKHDSTSAQCIFNGNWSVNCSQIIKCGLLQRRKPQGLLQTPQYQYLRCTGVTRGRTSSQQVEKGEIVAIVCCDAALTKGKRAPWSIVSTVLPPWDLQNAKTKERLDKLTSSQFHRTLYSNGHVTGQHAEARSESEGGGGGQRLIDPRSTSTYR
jgi:hypothetical protein